MPDLVAGVTLAEAAADLAAGLALLAAGAVTWARVPRSGTGPLLALAGAAWLAGDAWGALVYAHRGPLVHALLTYPSGRTRSPLIVGVIAAAYVDGLVPNLARAPWPTIALVVTVVGAATWRRAHARGLERRARTPPLVCAAGIAGALGLAAIGRLVGRRHGGGRDLGLRRRDHLDRRRARGRSALGPQRARGGNRARDRSRRPPGAAGAAGRTGPDHRRSRARDRLPRRRAVGRRGRTARASARRWQPGAGRHGRGGRRRARGRARA